MHYSTLWNKDALTLRKMTLAAASNSFIPECLKWTFTSLNLDMCTDANRGFSLYSKQNLKQCRSCWNGPLSGVLSGSTLLVKASVLVSRVERIKWFGENVCNLNHICKSRGIHYSFCTAFSYNTACAPSNSDQPVHPRSLIRVLTGRCR